MELAPLPAKRCAISTWTSRAELHSKDWTAKSVVLSHVRGEGGEEARSSNTLEMVFALLFRGSGKRFFCLDDAVKTHKVKTGHLIRKPGDDQNKKSKKMKIDKINW